MKKMKKIVSLLLTVVMVMAMTVVVSAADGDITASVDNQTAGHSYQAYQIFEGTQEANKTALGNIEWGSGITDEGKTALQTEYGVDSAAKIAELLVSDDAEKKIEAKDFAKKVSGYLSSSFTSISSDAASVEIQPGYYLIQDVTKFENGTTDTYVNLNLLQVTGNEITIEKKNDVPSVTKKVKEKDDSTGTQTDWQDGADYDLNDMVPFQLTGTMPSKIDDYTTYEYKFVDKISKGLTYNKDSVEVYVVNEKADGSEDKVRVTDQTSLITVSDVSDISGTDLGKYEGGKTFSVSISDVKALTGVTINKNTKIVVEYTATLNENAVVGAAGNPNKVHLEYSNNPNGEGTGETQEDEVIVFTFKLVVSKVDQDEQPLEGAKFTLYKWNAESQSEDKYEIVGTEQTGTVKKETVEGEEKVTSVTFDFSKLDAGRYKLVETATPSGYNKAADIEFQVVSGYDTNSATPGFISLVIKDLNDNSLSGNEEGATFTVNADETKEIGTTVVNNQGATLPETGGIGTTIFYVLGGILVVAAAILLVTKKRMSAEK